jgi:tyrosyl-DNA phosphodiesterase 2
VTPQSPRATNALRFVTFNVWFGKFYLAQRFRALMRILRECDADFVCLQEASVAFLELLRDDEWVRATYFLSDPHGDSFRTTIHYGVVMLSKRPPLGDVWLLTPLPTAMGRKLLRARFAVDEDDKGDGEEFVVATVHLESLQNPARRTEQLEVIKGILAPCRNVALMGDFNLCATSPENANVDRLGMVDSWAAVRPSEPGWTEDGTVNGMLALLHDAATRQLRFDRIMVRAGTWRPTAVELLGTQRLDPAEVGGCWDPVWPSDHFGLTCTIERK